jgi:hypothetical protein
MKTCEVCGSRLITGKKYCWRHRGYHPTEKQITKLHIKKSAKEFGNLISDMREYYGAREDPTKGKEQIIIKTFTFLISLTFFIIGILAKRGNLIFIGVIFAVLWFWIRNKDIPAEKLRK